MPHYSWDATRDGCNFYFSFCASFFPLHSCTHSPWSSCENSEKQVLKKRTVIILQPVLVPRWISGNRIFFKTFPITYLHLSWIGSKFRFNSWTEGWRKLTEGWNTRHDFIKPCYYFVKPWVQTNVNT